jgi:hypothetical protein
VWALLEEMGFWLREAGGSGGKNEKKECLIEMHFLGYH